MAAPSTRKPSKKTTPASSRANGRTRPAVAPAAAPEKPAVPARAARAAKTAKPAKPKAAAPKTPRVKPAKSVETKPDSVTAEQKAKRLKKEKVVRDSFTMPKSDYEKLAALKQKCLDAGVAVKKSELLRAGLLLLEGCRLHDCSMRFRPSKRSRQGGRRNRRSTTRRSKRRDCWVPAKQPF
jgi:hypothetical protein